MHEDDVRIRIHLRDAEPDRAGAGRSARDAARDLARPDLLGEEDRRLLPLRGNNDDDRVDARTALEPVEALREERPAAERRERLGQVTAQPLAAPGGDEHGPDPAHGVGSLAVVRRPLPGR